MYRGRIDNSIRALFWRVIVVRVTKGGPPPQRQRSAGVMSPHNSQIFLENIFGKFFREFFGWNFRAIVREFFFGVRGMVGLNLGRLKIESYGKDKAGKWVIPC